MISNLPDELKYKILNYHIHKNTDSFLLEIINWRTRMNKINSKLNIVPHISKNKSIIINIFINKNKNYLINIINNKNIINLNGEGKINKLLYNMNNFNYLCGILSNDEFNHIYNKYKYFILRIYIKYLIYSRGGGFIQDGDIDLII